MFMHHSYYLKPSKIIWVLLLALGAGLAYRRYTITSGATAKRPWKTEKKYEGVKVIGIKELANRMEASIDLLVLNVLSKDSFEDCRIRGSLSVPLHELESTSERWHKDQEIVVYCANYACSASKEAFLKLQRKGFTNIAAYEGGIQEWFSKGYPTAGPCVASFLK